MSGERNSGATPTEATLRALRVRWAAIGAAIAVALGAGGLGLVHAAPSTGGPVLVSITPCRLMDTRAASAVGPRTTPIGAGETYKVTAVGNRGKCTGIPADAVALSMNVTGLDATSATFLTVFPGGQARPDASNLNLSPGAPPTPNAVVSGLGNGQLSIYNRRGSADVIVDINGYYVAHNHDDRYVRLPVDEAFVHPGLFAAVGAVTGWEPVTGAAWTHTASVTSECVVAPLDLATGTPVTGIRVLYTASGNAAISISLIGAYRHAGTAFLPTLTNAATVPASPPGQIAEAVVPFVPPTSIADASYTLAICTKDTFAFTGVAVRLV